jgi:hypothetical protein
VQFTRRGLAVLSGYPCMAYAMMAWHLQMHASVGFPDSPAACSWTAREAPQHGVAASSAKKGVFDAEG